jgi:twitching motility protein PilT
MDIREVISQAVIKKGADIHLQEGRPPLIRSGSQLEPCGTVQVHKKDLQQWLETVSEETFNSNGEMSFAFSWNNEIRCRVHASHDYAGIRIVIRLLYPLAALPPDTDEALLARLGSLQDGLVLFCGATGSGKTTALWRILSYLNDTKACHIITLEDPVEYVLTGKKALLTQRELNHHFPTFQEGIKQALRQDPDVLLIGEMRDSETMEAAITAAETGRLVLSTLHTRSAAQAVSRLVGAFSAQNQEEVRCRLAMVLQAVLAQQRVSEGPHLSIVREVMITTPAVSQLIRSGKEHQLPSIIQTGAAVGMRTMEQALAQHRRRR